MFVGVARVVLQIPGARSLKDRRRVVKAFKDRTRARFPVSVAEVGDTERLQVATVGLAVVSNDSRRCREVLGSVRTMANGLPDALLADWATEVMSLGNGGSGVRGGIEQAFEEWDSEQDEDEPFGDDARDRGEDDFEEDDAR